MWIKGDGEIEAPRIRVEEESGIRHSFLEESQAMTPGREMI